MIVCASCGGQNPADAAFCGSCGAFLEWTGTAEETQAAPEPVTVSATETPAVPDVVQPGEEVRRRPRRLATPPRPPAAGEVACPSCGAGNGRERRFCRACGGPLAAAAPVRESWWRRLRRRLSRRRTHQAGTRRRVRQRRRMPRRLIALAVVAALGLLAAGPGRPQIQRYVDQIRRQVQDEVADPAPITPSGWEASSARPDAGPELLSDRVTNQFWAPEGDPVGAWAEATLPRPIRLLRIVITGGQSTEPEQFQEQARPHELTLTATAEDGTATTVDLVVRDQPGPQPFPLTADDVVTVRLEIESAHGMERGRYLAIGEIELFGR
jgi:hypothetical protein